MTPEPAPTPKFAIGDVVQLKSGGPLMTVQRNISPITCTWFGDYQSGPNTEEFKPECLMFADPTKQ